MTRKRTRTVKVHNTTAAPVVYDSAGHTVAGGKSVERADPNDKRTADLIAKRTLYVKES